jgi:hypothetical protein
VLLNPHALAIYLELIHALGIRLERFDECKCEDDNIHLFYRTSVTNDGHYRWFKGPINPLFIEQKAECIVRTIR